MRSISLSHVSRTLLAAVLGLGVLAPFWPDGVRAHDAGAWGGLFRSRDNGVTWFQASQGRLVTGVLSIAVSPIDSTRLLLGTDAGMLVTHNGGLDWAEVAP